MLTRSRSRLALVVAIILAAAVATAAQSSSVFVTAKGTHYHTHEDCRSLRSSNVLSIALDKIGARTLCTICQRRDAKK